MNKGDFNLIRMPTEPEMQDALTSIAQELQRFYNSGSTITKVDQNGDTLEHFNIIKTSLKLKKRQVKKLRTNLNIACIVARTVLSAKENETYTLTKHISLARSQCESLLQKSKSNFKAVDEIKLENEILKDKLEAMRIFIRLGYEKLQNMRNKPIEEMTLMQQLKEIMVCCGQYYADYYNEHEEKKQIEQKNRFLSHKINILTKNMETMTEELSSIRRQNIRYQKENDLLLSKHINAECFPITHKIKKKTYSNDKQLQEKTVKPHNLDLNSHLSIVKKLLNNQNDMLMDLKILSDELTVYNHKNS